MSKKQPRSPKEPVCPNLCPPETTAKQCFRLCCPKHPDRQGWCCCTCHTGVVPEHVTDVEDEITEQIAKGRI